MSNKSFCIFIFLISSCTSQFDQRYNKLMKPIIKIKQSDKEQRSFDGDIEPAFPDPELNLKTILGIDSNKNFVRDDVEIYINRSYHDTNVRRALKQFVKDKTNFMAIKTLDSEVALKAAEKSRLTMYCIDFVFPSKTPKEVGKFYDLILNSDIRDEAYGRSLQIIGRGKLIEDRNELDYKESDKYCEFKIENYEVTRKKYLQVFDSYMGKTNVKK